MISKSLSLQNEVSQVLVFEGKRYAVRKVFGSAAKDAPNDSDGPIVVTFPHAGGPTMNQRVAFGEIFLKTKGIDAYHLLNAEVDWFQHPEFWDAISAIHMDAPAGREVVAYGASMGGHGALLASSRLAASRVLAVVPQYSIDRDVVPFEKRWKDHAAKIGTFIHDIDAEIDPDGQIFTLHDPRNIDQRQMNLFTPMQNWEILKIPYGGHTPLMGLQQAKILSGFVTDIIYGTFDHDVWKTKLLRARRDSISYWRVIATHAVRLNRIAFAEHAISQMQDLGAHHKELEVTRATIDRNIESAARRAAQKAEAIKSFAARKEQQSLAREQFAQMPKEAKK